MVYFFGSDFEMRKWDVMQALQAAADCGCAAVVAAILQRRLTVYLHGDEFLLPDLLSCLKRIFL